MKADEKLTLEEVLRMATCSIPVAGRLFLGIGRDSSYQAAKTGQIPTLDVNGLKRVPVATMAEKVGLRHQVGKKAVQ